MHAGPCRSLLPGPATQGVHWCWHPPRSSPAPPLMQAQFQRRARRPPVRPAARIGEFPLGTPTLAALKCRLAQERSKKLTFHCWRDKQRQGLHGRALRSRDLACGRTGGPMHSGVQVALQASPERRTCQLTPLHHSSLQHRQCIDLQNLLYRATSAFLHSEEQTLIFQAPGDNGWTFTFFMLVLGSIPLVHAQLVLRCAVVMKTNRQPFPRHNRRQARKRQAATKRRTSCVAGARRPPSLGLIYVGLSMNC